MKLPPDITEARTIIEGIKQEILTVVAPHLAAGQPVIPALCESLALCMGLAIRQWPHPAEARTAMLEQVGWLENVVANVQPGEPIH